MSEICTTYGLLLSFNVRSSYTVYIYIYKISGVSSLTSMANISSFHKTRNSTDIRLEMHHLHNPSPAKAVNRNFFLLVASIRAFFFSFLF